MKAVADEEEPRRRQASASYARVIRPAKGPVGNRFPFRENRAETHSNGGGRWSALGLARFGSYSCVPLGRHLANRIEPPSRGQQAIRQARFCRASMSWSPMSTREQALKATPTTPAFIPFQIC